MPQTFPERLEGSPPAPLLSAKLTIPPAPPVQLPRPRLLDALTTGAAGRLTAVTGPAGAGKTVLVSAWARSGAARGPVAWLTLDDEDNVPATFWSYVLAALRVGFPDLDDGLEAVAHGHSINRSLLGRLATSLAEVAPPALLVLDRAEHIANRAIAADLDLLLRYSTPGLRLIVVGRSARIVALHRYRLAGELTEVGADALALAPEETAGLLDRHGVAVDAEEAAALHAGTEGWVTGVCLQAYARQTTRASPAIHHTAGEFLRGEVFDGQTARARDLLLRTSIIERIPTALADRLTGRYDARSILDGLVRVNAFVQPTGDGAYRVHPLFREVLRDELTARHPDLVRRLHGQAARWYAEHGHLEDALSHATRVGDWNHATELILGRVGVARLLSEPYGPALRAPLATLADDAPGVPAAVVRGALALARFDLAAARAELDRVGGQARHEPIPVQVAAAALGAVLGCLAADGEGAHRDATRAEALLALLSPAEAVDEPGTRSLLFASLGAAQLWVGDHPGARASLARAAGMTDPPTAYRAHAALGHLALLELAEGRLHRADAYARESLAVADAAGLGRAQRAGAASAALAGVALERNDLPGVREQLSRAVSAPDAAHDPMTAMTVALVRVHAASGRGDGRRALAAVHAARAALAGWRVSAAALTAVELSAAHAHLAAGEPDAARRCLDMVPDGPARLVVLARIRAAKGARDEALRLVADVPAHTPPAILQRIALLRAELAVADGDPYAARRAVRDALEHARPERRRRPFAEAGGWLQLLLRQYPELTAEHGWLANVPDPPADAPARGVFPPAGAAPPAPRPLAGAADRPAPLAVVEQLTAREVEVLQRLARAMSTDDIATEMYLSVNTVKTHLRSIYRKLGTSGRSATARRARELNLLDEPSAAGRSA
jgi:LuxR family maltose regulon positive regulatory protein